MVLYGVGCSDSEERLQRIVALGPEERGVKPGPDTYSVSSAYDLVHTRLSASVFPSTCLQQFTGPVSTLYGSASLVRPLSSSNLGEHKEVP